MNIKELLLNLSKGATKFLIDLVIAILLLVIGLKLINYLNKVLKREHKFSKLDPSVKSFIVSFITIGLKFLLFVVALIIVGIPSATLITVMGSCAVAIGLAMQGGLSNIAGGLMILIFKPFKVGDYISVNGNEGTVKSITLFYTTITTVDNKTVQLPNGNLSNSNIINYTYCKTRRVDLKISVAYNSNITRVKSIINDIVEDHEFVLKDEEITIRLLEHADSALVFAVRAWCKKEDYWKLYFDLMEEVKEALDKNKIEIPYPQVDVHMKK